MISSNIALPNLKNEEEIMEKTKDFVRYLIFDNEMKTKTFLTKNSLLSNIIKKYKCDLVYADAIFSNMENLGLNLCKTIPASKFLTDNEIKYYIFGFAEMRGFLSEKELQDCIQKMEEYNQKAEAVRKKEDEKIKESERKIDELDKKFIVKYGDKSRWSKEIWDEYDVESDAQWSLTET